MIGDLTIIEFCLAAGLGIVGGLSLLYLYWRFIYVRMGMIGPNEKAKTTNPSERSFWTELLW